MAIELLDEHEQSERVRNWLRNNFGSIFIGLAGGISAIWAWGYFQDWRIAKRDQASNEYTRYLAAVENKDDLAIKVSGNALRDRYADTPYAVLSAMSEAEKAFSSGNPLNINSAIASLDWAYQHAKLPELRDLAALRLARVHLDAGKLDGAMRLAMGISAKGFSAQAAEIRGDVYLARGQISDARMAYEQALVDLEVSSARRRFVEMKRDDLPTADMSVKVGS